MTITKEIIADLLPLYVAGDCSADTRRLVEEFLKNDPGLAAQLRAGSSPALTGSVTHRLTPNDELAALARTRRLLRLRSTLMAFAIFCSLTPFSFLYTNGRIYWLFGESPITAGFYLLLGIVFWVAYAVIRRRLSDL